MTKTIFFLLGLLVVFAGLIISQIILSKKESKWFGLILPIITFIVSLLFVFSVAAAGNPISTVIVTVLSAFLLCNISTAILLVIYAVCRKK
ncbi:MAG: hypothetical protein LBB91_02955 [Clostridiales bacterium]|nr:hypothetical protein [Clostridiales bacterium]